MSNAYTWSNPDAELGTALAQIVAAPGAGLDKRVSLTFCNKGAATATVDLTRYDGTTDRYLMKSVDVAVGKPVVLTDIALVGTRSLRARASAATTIDVTVDEVKRTVV